MRWISSRLDPKTLTPTGVRIPVASMSMRFLIGIVQALALPGIWTARSISLMRSSCEMCSGQIWPSIARKGPGHEEKNRCFGGHSDIGLSCTTVSIIENGAGSVDVSARPALPCTETTSGNCFRMRSCVSINRCASVTEMPGNVVGM